MIDWDATERQFGYKSLRGLSGKRPPVIVICDGENCRKSRTIKIRGEGRYKFADNQLTWLCPACVGKRRSAEISVQMTRKWAEDDYRATQSEAIGNIWDQPGYREKHSIAVKAAMARIDMSTILVERYKDPAARLKLKEISDALWRDEEFRIKHLTAMQQEGVRAAISKEAKERWTKESYRKLMAEIRLQQLGAPSSPQRMLYQHLRDLGIRHFEEGPETLVAWYAFDCLIPDHNVLVEVQGEYWHGDEKSQHDDRAKQTYISRYFPQYEIMYFWEREFHQQGRVAQRLGERFSRSYEPMNFDFTEVEVRYADTTAEFLDLYYYLGPGYAGTRLAAYLAGQMISVAVFSNPKLGETAECSKFCVHPRYLVPGFASWFLRQCADKLQKPLIATLDPTTHDYRFDFERAGWRLDHIKPPAHWWADHEGFVMSAEKMAQKAGSFRLSPEEFATKYGYTLVTGREKYCYSFIP